jgi:hypothetical protein
MTLSRYNISEETEMATATYEAVVQNGAILLPEGVTLPERATVYIVVPGTSATNPIFEVTLPSRPRIYSPRLKNRADAARFVMEVEENAPDAPI